LAAAPLFHTVAHGMTPLVSVGDAVTAPVLVRRSITSVAPDPVLVRLDAVSDRPEATFHVCPPEPTTSGPTDRF